MKPPVDVIPPQVNVHFIGICTHLTGTTEYPPGTLMPVARSPRVVLVDASNGLRIQDKGIPPHSALLFIPPRFVVGLPEGIDGLTTVAPGLPSAWRMSGVQLELEPGNPQLSFGEGYDCLPSLTAALGLDEKTDPSLDLDARVVDDGDLACAFLIRGGTLAAYSLPGPAVGQASALIGRLTVDIDDWTNVQLKVTRIWNQRTSTIQLRRHRGENPHIIIANVGTTTDAEDDFTLHYLTTTLAPEEPIAPPPCAAPPASSEDEKALEDARVIFVTTGLAEGCSNSQYP